jgi:inositol 1,4,5-triphosphate receptor type 1/inositol 1,4,5-triphosphate receptor type 3
MIIDAFGNLRDQKASDDEDRKNRCFICGIDRSEYERHANFEDHVTEEHNVWAYVYYLTYVLEKYKNDKNSLTDLENHVVEKFQTKNYGWFPNKSLTLEKCYEKEKIQKDSEEESLAQKIDALRNEMKSQMTIIQAKLPSGKPLAARQQKVKAKPLEEKKEVE